MEAAVIAINLMLSLLDRASAIGALLKRGNVTQTDLDALFAADDAARAALQAEINRQKIGGA